MTLPALLVPEVDTDTLKGRPWGGPRLARWRGAPGADGAALGAPGALPIGESWEFSTLAGAESRALGRPLGELLGHPLPFLAKLIDTASPLSLQVHPADDPRTGETGKEEAWVILEAEPGAELRVGLRRGVDLATLGARTRAAVADPSAGAALLDCFEPLDVRPGDVVLVPARTPHAIGGGILLAEIQQPADCTFRYYDYGSDREIHVEAALAATDPKARPQRCRFTDAGPQPIRLAGEHIALAVYFEGHHDVPATAHERLLIPARGASAVRSQDGEVVLRPGELRLLTQGALELRLGPGAQLVVGEITPAK